MATDVQQLLLQIDANTELARRELSKMESGFDSFNRRAESVAGGVEGSFTKIGSAANVLKANLIGFAAGLGIDAVIGFGRAILNAADDLATAADQAGVAVERYQTLTESLRVLEVDADSVNRIFGKLQDTLGSVQNDSAAKGVVDALDRMGINSRILNGEITTTDGLLDAIAASSKNYRTEAEFTADVIAIVGKRVGVELAAALKDGGIALKQGEQNFRDAGGVISEEYVNKLADANEALDRFTARSKSQLIIFAGQTIDFFQQATDAITKFQEAEDAAFLRGIDRALGVNAPAQGKPASNTSAKSRDAATLAQLQPGTGVYASLAQDYFRKYGEAPPQPEAPIITVTASKLGKASGPARAPRGGRSSGASKPSLSPAQLRDNADVSPQAATIIGGDLATPLVDLQNIKVALDGISAGATDLSNIKILDTSALEVGLSLLDDVSNSILDSIDGANSLGDALVKAFIRAGLELFKSGLLKAFELSGGGGGSGSDGGGGSSDYGSIAKAVASIFGGGFANGGSPPLGKVSIVGERGPELFVPRVPGTIIPNSALGGGGGTTIVNDLRGSIVETELYNRINQSAAQAAQAGAIGGKVLAAQDRARRQQRSLAR